MPVTYDNGATSGTADGTLVIVGEGELTQTLVSAALDEHFRQFPEQPVLVLNIGPLFVSLGPAAINGTTLQSIVFDSVSQVTSIGASGLSNNRNLTKVVLPQGLLHLAPKLFADCVLLATVDLPSDIETIGFSCFENCPALTTVTIPSLVTTIVDRAFEHCSSLGSAVFSFGSTLAFLGESIFGHCTMLTSVDLPMSLGALGHRTFLGCIALATIQLPESVIVLGNATFDDCTALVDVGFSSTLETMGDQTFRGCTMLQTVDFSSSTLSSVGNALFETCTALTTVTFPSSLDALGDRTFVGCTNLASIDFPDSILRLGDATFEQCTSLTNIGLSTTLQNLGDRTFGGCTALVSIQFPENVLGLGKETFGQCNSLTSVGFPILLQNLGDRTFLDCTAIQTVVFPQDLPAANIGIDTFKGAATLQTLRMHRDSWDRLSMTIVDTTTQRLLVTFYSEQESVYSKTLVLQRDHWAYDQVAGTVSRDYDATMDLLGDGDLSQAQVDAALAQHEERFPGQPLNIMNIGPLFVSLGASAISGTSLQSIVFDALSKVTTIGASGLSNNQQLTNVTLPKGLLQLGDSIFKDCIVLPTVDLPTSLGALGHGTFKGCSALTSIQFPESVVGLGNETFGQCVALTNLGFPTTLKNLGDQTFFGCTAIQTVVFPPDLPVANVGVNTFEGAIELRTLRMQKDSWDRLSMTIVDTTTQRLLVTFYSEAEKNSVYSKTLVLQRDHWAYDQVAGTVSRDYDATIDLLGDGELTQSQVGAALDQHEQRFPGQPLLSMSIGPLFVSLGTAAINGTGLESIVFDSLSKVTSIGAAGLSNNQALTKVELPPGLLHLAPKLFADCVLLATIGLPSGIETIGFSCFQNCPALTIITIPSSVTTIVDRAFDQCSSLGSAIFSPISTLIFTGEAIFSHCTTLSTVDFPMSLGALSQRTFLGCTTLATIQLPKSIIVLGKETFDDCTALVDVTFSTKLETLGDRTFRGCTMLQTVDFSNTTLASVGNALFDTCSALTTVTFPSSLDALGDRTFVGCTNLASIDFPDSILRFGDATFEHCTSLLDVGLSTVLQNLGDRTFKGCTALVSIQFPEGVLGLGSETFGQCTALTSVDFPTTLQNLGDRTFFDCTAIQKVVFPPELPVANIGIDTFEGAIELRTLRMQKDSWDRLSMTIVDTTTQRLLVTFYSEEEKNSVYSKNPLELQRDHWAYHQVAGTVSRDYDATMNLLGDGELTEAQVNAALGQHEEQFPGQPLNLMTIGPLFVSLGASAIKGTSLQSIVFDALSKVTTIGASGLSNNQNLINVTLPKGLLQLGDSMFKDCIILPTVELPTSLGALGHEIFKGCSALTSIQFPESVVGLGNETFGQCVSLTNIGFSTLLQNLGAQTFLGCTALQTVVFPEGLPVANIGANTFQGAVKVQTLKMHRDSWNFLSTNIVDATTQRLLVTFYSDPNSVYSKTLELQRDHWAYDQVAGTVSRDYDATIDLLGDGELTQKQVGAALDQHEQRFPGQPLLSMTIGPLFVSLDTAAINGTSLQSIVFDSLSKVTEIGAAGLSNNQVLTKVVLPPGLLHLAPKLFAECVLLPMVVLPPKIETIGFLCFQNCRAMTTLTIPSLVTTIVDRAFEGCSLLDSVLFSPTATLAYLGDALFPPSLTTIEFPLVITSLSPTVFREATGLETFKISRSLWDTIALPTNTSSVDQVVQFEDDPDTYYTLQGDALIAGTGLSYNVVDGILSGTYNGPSLSIVGSGPLARLAIDTYLGSNRSPKTVTVDAAITTVTDSVFSGLKALTNVLFEPNSVITSFGDTVFKDCVLLTNIVLPENLTTMGTAVFENCLLLPKIDLPLTLQSIPAQCFQGCAALASIVVPAPVTIIGSLAFHGCTSLFNVDFTPVSTLQVLEDSVFKNCVSLVDIVLPDGLTTVGTTTFEGCSLLESVVFPQSLETNIGTGTFALVTTIQTLKMHETLWTVISVPLNTDEALQVVSFHSAPDVYQTVDAGGNLVSGTGFIYDINGGLTGSYSNLPLEITGAGELTKVAMALIFKQYGSRPLTLNIGKDITSLSASVFSGGAKTLTTVHFPAGSALTTLGDRAFQDCTLLKEVVFPGGLTTLGTNTFENCTSLQNLVFPRTLVALDGTETLASTTTLRSLRMHKELWKNSIRSSLVPNPDFAQLVRFYSDVQGLETQRDLFVGTDAEGYQDIIDYYTKREIYTVDRSGGTTELARGGTMTYDNGVLTGIGTYGGTLTITGGTELTQSIVDAAIAAHAVAQSGLVPLRTLTIGANFTSMAQSLSLRNTSVTNLLFPAESLLTTTGAFGLLIDSNQPVVLPQWVTL